MQITRLPASRFSFSLRAALWGLALSGLGVALGPGLQAQRDVEVPISSTVPPLVENRTVTVQRGESLEIPLESRGKRGETVTFMIRSAPVHGTLSGSRRVNPESGMVTYQNNGLPGHSEDSFTFAAQSAGTPVSAPARITIRVVDPPPAVAAESTLDFGPIPVGESQEKVLKVENIGGLTVESRLDVLPPFYLKEGFPVNYTLEKGQHVMVPLVYRPTAPGNASSVMKLRVGYSEVTLLRGVATAPFSLTPGLLTLRENPSQTTAPLLVANHTAQEMKVQLTWTPGFTGPPEVVVPPNGQVEATVGLAGENPLALVGEVRGSAGDLTLNTRLQARALPGRLEAPDALDFGRTSAPAENLRKLSLRNTGGAPLMLEVRRVGDFVVPGLQEVIPLEPGQSVEYEVYPPQKKAGSWFGGLYLTHSGVLSHAIRLQGVVEKAPTGAASRPRTVATGSGTASAGSAAPSSTPAAPRPTAAALPPPGTDTAAPVAEVFGENIAEIMAENYGDHPIQSVKVQAQDPTTVQLEWLSLEIPEQELYIQLASLSLDGEGQLRQSWQKAKHTTVQRGPKADSVLVSDLPAGRRSTVRIVRLATPTSDLADAEPLSHAFSVSTPIPPPPFWRSTSFLLGVGALVVILALMVLNRAKKNRR